ncbi:MAG: YifB family Mg chelatase-like AAA ATPase, partial [Candidatus Aminicenantes bacterium]|nr:YifB family Mg chelatase-like AAA ATPase [Candidatus Aminicenantes bacterium]
MLYKLTSATLCGIEAQAVDMEIDIAGGLPGMIIVGLPDTSVRESKDRVRAAMKNSGFPLPPAKIVINLAPADLKKEGSGFDLPLSVGLLAHLGHFPAVRLDEYLFLGELALDGRLKPIRGVLACAVLAEQEGFRGIVCPKGNEAEAALVGSLAVYGLSSLSEVVGLLKNPSAWEPAQKTRPQGEDEVGVGVNFAHIHGQAQVKRALEVAAAGGHHVLMIGPPGAGKTLLARAMPSIMPPLSESEIIEVTRIYSAVGLLGRRGAILTRPFRSPHHTVTDAGLIGGGLVPRPGEVTLAHQGILFLDELPEFRRKVLEDLRQPLEDGQITISRGARAVTFPSNFML